MTQIDFFFDCSSPWTYLAFENYLPLAEKYQVTTHWRPILVGGIFNTINPTVYASREKPVVEKQAYQKKDLMDWARFSGIDINSPPTVFPVNSVKAMRACIVADRRGQLVPYAKAVFEIYWAEDQDISQPPALEAAARRAGFTPEDLYADIGTDEIKDELRANTGELMRRGGFGSPTLFVNGEDMYFGNDRLPLVEAAIKAAAS